MRWLFLVAVSSAAACQCFVPPEELLPDAGGPDAGAGAGSRTDAGLECRQASDCTVPQVMLEFCSAPGAHCLDGRCVVDCNGGLTCNAPTATSDCIDCQGTPSCRQCGFPRCLASNDVVLTVPPGACPSPLADGGSFLVVAQRAPKPCGLLVDRDGGQAMGEWFGQLDGGRALLSIPALGGTCIASDLFTGLPRTRVSCPRCTFVWPGCE